MNLSKAWKNGSRLALIASALCAGGANAQAGYKQTNLVSDVAGLAMLTDPSLVNPWGVSFLDLPTGASPFWISNQGTNTSTLYSVQGATGVSKLALTVSIPTLSVPPNGPTGQVANTGNGFQINGGSPARFIFADLNGQISAWNGGTSAVVQATGANAVYTGLAKNQAQDRLYAVNAVTGAIDTFDSNFSPTALGGSAFAAPASVAASGFVPFNVQDIGGSVYVTYAPAGRGAQTTAGPGQGAVAVFDENGALQKVIQGGPLAAPWGVALAPAGFGEFGSDILVGNFSFTNSGINAFDATTGDFVGSIAVNPGAGQTPGGLWALTFGGGGRAGDPLTLYFSDGIDGETHGLFGAVAAVPEASTWVMALLGFAALGLSGRRSKRLAA